MRSFLFSLLWCALSCNRSPAEPQAAAAPRPALDHTWVLSGGQVQVVASPSGLAVGPARLAFGTPGEPHVNGDRVEFERVGFTEWLRADVRGVEHGFDVRERPAGDLVISGRIEGAPVAVTGENEVRIGTFAYTDALARDVKGQAFPVSVKWEEASRTLELRVAAADVARAEFPLVVDPLFTTIGWQWTSPLPTTYAPVRVNQYRLAWGNIHPTEIWGDQFSPAVAGVGDIDHDGFNDVVAGAPMYPQILPSGLALGAILVFRGSATGLSQTPIVIPEPTGVAGSRFGQSIAAAGDVDGDQFADVLVGAPDFDGVAADGGVIVAKGRVYLYRGSATGLSATPSWVYEGVNRPCARLGAGLASADFNHDGKSDIAVGAPSGVVFGSSIKCEIPLDAVTPGVPGEVSVFLGSPTGPANTPDWSASPAGVTNNNFFGIGHSLATGDFNHDGNPDLLVGAPFSRRNSNPLAKGAVLLFSGNGATLAATASSPWPSNQPNWTDREPSGDAFREAHGLSVDNAGDVNGDGIDDVLLGSPGWGPTDGGALYVGRAYAYAGGTAGVSSSRWTWSPEGMPVPFESNYGKAFGTKVRGVGDVNGDGFSDVVIAAPGGTPRVFLFQGSAAGLSSEPVWTFTGRRYSSYGADVANVGDVNGDGLADIMLGNTIGQFTLTDLPDGGQTTSGLLDAGDNRVLEIFYGCSERYGRVGGGVCPWVLPPVDGGTLDAGQPQPCVLAQFSDVPLKLASVNQQYRYNARDAVVHLSSPDTTVSLIEGPAGMQVQCSAGSCTLNWTPKQVGVFPVRLLASNRCSAALQTFSVRTVQVPEIVRTVAPDTTAMLGVPYTFTPQALGDQPIVWSLRPLANGPVAGRATGAVTWTPAVAGTYALEFTATNAFGSDTFTFPAVVVASPERAHITGPANLNGQVGQRYVYSATGVVNVTPVGVPLRVTSGPPGFRVDPLTHEVMWVPQVAGDQTISLVAGTPPRESDTFTFVVHVADPLDAAPTARGTATPNLGNAPLTGVVLDGTASTATTGRSLALFTWDRGDGTPLVYDPIAPAHTYSAAGGYTAHLQVFDDYGQSNSVSVPISVTADGVAPPVCDPQVTNKMAQPSGATEVTFEARCKDPQGNPLSYFWTFGDAEVPSSSAAENPTFTYATASVYRVKLWASNGPLQTFSTLTVALSDKGKLPPEVRAFASPTRAMVGQTIRLTSTARDYDGVIVKREWKLPDGTQVYLDAFDYTVTEPMDATQPYRFVFTATDSDGLRSSDSVEIELVNSDDLARPVFRSTCKDCKGTQYIEWKYDEDSTPSVRPGPPNVTFRLGTDEFGKTVGEPPGATIDATTGKISWKPTQHGSFRMDIVATNAAGEAVQTLIIDIAPGEAPPAGCPGCNAGSAGPFTLVALMLLALRRRRIALPVRVRSLISRGGALLVVGLLATTANAAPVFTSTPNTAPAWVDQPWAYASDGGNPTCDAGAPVEWRVEGSFLQPDGGSWPADSGVQLPILDINNVTGQLYFLATAEGLERVKLRVEDGFGAQATQDFTIRVVPQPPPQIAPPMMLTATVNSTVTGTFRLAAGSRHMVWALDPPIPGLFLQSTNGNYTWTPVRAGTGTSALTVVTENGKDSVMVQWSAITGAPVLPTAGFTFSPLEPQPKSDITFTQQVSSNLSDLTVNTWFDWGDGQKTAVGTGDPRHHAYSLPGSYNVRQYVTNAQGQRAIATASVPVGVAGLVPPSAHIVVDVSSGPAPLTVKFSCGDCVKGSGELESFRWDFGDRIESTQRDPGSHIYTQAAGYNVRLRVTDTNGLEATDTVYIRVADGVKLPPRARARASETVGDADFHTTLVAEFEDPESEVTRRVWELADGRTFVDVDPDIVISKLGEFDARLTVTNSLGLSSTDTLTLAVTKNGALPPQITSFSRALTATRGRPWSYDQNGTPSARGTPNLKWELGIPTMDNKRLNVPPGAVIDLTTGQITWTPGGTDSTALMSIRVSNAASDDVQTLKIQIIDEPQPEVPVKKCSSTPGTALSLMGLGLLATLRRRIRPAR